MRIRKLIAVALAALALCMTFVACDDKETGKDMTASAFPVSSYNDTVEVTMGDVMPFYDDGVMNIYHLQNSRGSLSTYYHPISRLTTTDFLHYTDEGIAIPFEEKYNSPDAAIGTGSFIKDEKGNVQKAKIISLEPKKDEKTGRMNMVPVEGTEQVMDAQLVLIAAGFLGSQKYVTDAFQVEVNSRTNVWTKPDEYATSVPGVFTAGDMHRGQSLVVWAIAEGRRAAEAVDLDLMGY